MLTGSRGHLAICLAALLATALVACSRPAAGSTSPVASATAAATVVATTSVGPTALPSAETAGPRGALLFLRRGEGEGALNDEALLVLPAGSAPLDLGPAIDASWAADGRSIHLVTQGTGCVPKLTTLAPDGAVQVVVEHGLLEQDGAFAWSPDGRMVAFLRYHNGAPPKSCGSQGGVYSSDAVVQDIMVMNVDGTEQRVLLPLVWPSRPMNWSSDGTRIVIAASDPGGDGTRFDAIVVDVATGSTTSPSGTQIDGMTSPRWSPDGARLVFGFYIDGVTHIGVLPAAGGDLLDLDAGRREFDREPVWSPSGREIAATFDSALPDGSVSRGNIAIVPIDAGDRRDLGLDDVQTFAGPPSWSTDGNWLAYVRTTADGTGAGGIGVVAADGLQRRAVPATDGAEWVVWQPAP